MSNLSELLPSGGGQNVVSLTASGTISEGQPVILNSDGTVSVPTSSSTTEGLGTPAAIDGTNDSYGPQAAYDPTNDKVLVVYRNSSGYLSGVIGTVSGTSISFGSPVQLNSSSTKAISLIYYPDQNTFIAFYEDASNSDYSTMLGLQISGSTINTGSALVISSMHHRFGAMAYNSTDNHVFAIYSDANAHMTYRVITMSGTTLTNAGGAYIESGEAHYNGASVAYCPHQYRMLVTYTDQNNHGNYKLYSNSGTTYTAATNGQFDSYIVNTRVVHIGSSQFFIAGRDSSLNGSFYVATVSGDTITFGSEVTFGSFATLGLIYDSYADKVVLSYPNEGQSADGYYVVGTVTGTGASGTVSFGTPVVYEPANSVAAAYDAEGLGAAFDSTSNQVILTWYNRVPGSGAEAVVLTNEGSSTTLTATNTIGIAAKAIANSAAGDINVLGGISTVHSGLTIGSDYYVQSNGAITTTSDSPAVLLGQAISATTINMRNLT